MKKIGKSSVLLMICFAVFLSSAGLTSAYLSKKINQAVNVVTPGDVKIRLSEPGWNHSDGENLIPQALIPKDPVVTNTGSVRAWIFQQVKIPLRRISVVDPATGRKKQPSKTELFSFHEKENWIEIEKKETAEFMEYVYGYEIYLDPGESTVPLFHQVQLVNYLEGELDPRENYEIPVTAYGIQTHTVLGEGDGSRADAEKLRGIWSEYLMQEQDDRKGAAGA